MDFGRFSGRLVCVVFVGDEIYGVLFVCLWGPLGTFRYVLY